jgi:PAS domain-containing protein
MVLSISIALSSRVQGATRGGRKARLTLSLLLASHTVVVSCPMRIRNFFCRLLGLPTGPRPDEDGTLFRSMVEQSGDVICHVVDSRFTYVSPSAAALFGWDPQAMIGTTGLDLVYEPICRSSRKC